MKTDGQTEQQVNKPQNSRKNGNIKVWIIMIVLVIVVGMVFVFSTSLYLNAKVFGQGVGTLQGRIIGVAKGSYEGITKGIPLGLQHGKEAGKSAEDTEVKVKNKMESVGNLEVLAAGVRIDNVHQYSDQYAAIYVYKANAVFSIDLNQVEINEGSDVIQIFLPEIQVEMYVDDSSVEKLAQWQKNLYSGSAKDGYDAYINSVKNIEKKSPQEMENYEALMSQAREMAKKQVAILAESICGKDKKIEIDFIQERNDK